MGDIYPGYGRNSTSLVVTSLGALANDAYWNSNRIHFGDEEYQPEWVQIHVDLKSSTVAGAAGGFCELWLAGGLSTGRTGSTGGTRSGLAGNVGITAGVFAGVPTDSDAIANAQFLGVISMNTTGTTGIEFSADFIAQSEAIPNYGSLVIHNRQGALLNTSGNAVDVLFNRHRS